MIRKRVCNGILQVNFKVYFIHYVLPVCLTAGAPCHLPVCIIARMIGLIHSRAVYLPLVQFVHNPPRYLPNVLNCLGSRSSPTHPPHHLLVASPQFPVQSHATVPSHPRNTSFFPEAARRVSAHPDGDHVRQDRRSTPRRTPPHRSVRRQQTRPRTTRRIPRDTRGCQGDASRQPQDRTPTSGSGMDAAANCGIRPPTDARTPSTHATKDPLGHLRAER